MIKSMTGYGRAVATIDGREITAEIRSVNNRYLDCSVKLPRLYVFAEEAIKAAVKDYYDRNGIAYDPELFSKKLHDCEHCAE